MFYIYHIKGVKIGCSTQPKKRVEKQGYSSYEILEEHSCIDSASKRELELQKEYGYNVDKVPYYHSIKMFEKATDYWRGRREQLKNIEKYNFKYTENLERAHQTMRDNGFFNDWYKKGNAARIKGVIMLDKQTEEPIKEFKSVSDAARYINKEGKTSVISACCKGKRPSIYGYKWKYKDSTS